MKLIKYLIRLVTVFILCQLIISCGGDSAYKRITWSASDIDAYSKLTTVRINPEKLDLADEINTGYSNNLDWPKTDFIDAVKITNELFPCFLTKDNNSFSLLFIRIIFSFIGNDKSIPLLPLTSKYIETSSFLSTSDPI